MNISIKRAMLLFVLLGSLLLLPAIGACGDDDETAQEETAQEEDQTPTDLGKPVKISQTFALTGPYASQHKEIFEAYEDYIKFINDNGGLKDTNGISHPLEMLWVDDKMEVTTELSFFEKAKADGSLIHGSLYSSAYGALLPKAEKEKIPLFCFSSSNMVIDPQRTGYSMFPYYEDVLGAYVDWFLQTWDKPSQPKLAIIALDNAYGKSALGSEILDFIESRGVDVVAKEVVDAVPVDTTANLIKIQNADADFIYAQVIAPTAAVIARDMQKLDIELTIASPAPMGPSALLDMAPEACDGWIGMLWAGFYADDDRGVKFMRDLQTEYRGSPMETDQYALGIASVMTMVEAVRLAMEEVPFDELSPEKVWQFGINRIENFDTEGILPPINLGVEHGYYGQNHVRPVQIQGTQIKWIDDFIKCPDTMAYKEYYQTEGKAIAEELAGE